MSKVRSRNYPSLSLPLAIERARELYKKEGRARMDAASAVAVWGYRSLNGASLRVLSALRQYGLLEGSNEELRLSPTGLTLILEPEESHEYREALSSAFAAPAIFAEVREDFGRDMPSDGTLVSYLVRKKNLGEPAAKMLVAAFRDSLDMVVGRLALDLGESEPFNVPSHVPQKEQTKPMPTKEIEQQTKASGLSFSWPLSTDTVLTITLTGAIPSPDEVEDIPALLELAKTKIQRVVAKAASESAAAEVVADADYTVESP